MHIKLHPFETKTWRLFSLVTDARILVNSCTMPNESNHQVEQTLVVLKPDAVARSLTGRIIQRFDDALLKIVAIKMVWMDKALVQEHYRDAADRHGPDVFILAQEFMLSGPVIAIVLEGVNAVAATRKMVGSTYPGDALPGTIRGDYAHQTRSYSLANNTPVGNVIHASESTDEARREIALWFLPEEIHSHRRPSDAFAFKGS